MSLSDITLALGFAAWTFPPGIGASMLMSTNPSYNKPARLLFWLSPIGPIVALSTWIISIAPPAEEVFVACGLVGSLVSVTLVELLRWQEIEHEKSLGKIEISKAS